MAPDVSTSASIWDSYDADEEAAVLAMSSSPGIEYKAQSGKPSGDRQGVSSRRKAQEACWGPVSTNHVSNAHRKQHDSSKSSSGDFQMIGPSSWDDESSTETTAESLTRRTEEDMYPELPLFM